jgi:hypothetical protein
MDVAEETSDRRPQAMENAKRGGHDTRQWQSLGGDFSR